MNPFRRASVPRVPVRAEAPSPREGDGAVTMRLYEPLDSWGGEWGVSAKEFAAALDDVPRDTAEIQLLINSPGGEVWEGLAVLNALRAHPARVVAVVEGIAASAASFIAAGADELRVMKNAEVFIHNAWGLAVGNSADMAKLAADLEHEDRNIASIYAAKAGGDVEKWLAAMAAETWYSAEEAVDAGLADKVIDPKSENDGAAKAKARFDLSIFAQHGRAEKPRATKTSGRAGGTTQPKEGAGMDPDFEAGLRQRLGISADTAIDEKGFLAALDEALNERADSTTTQAPEGTVLVDKAVWDQTRADATAGAAARAEQVAAHRAALVEAAIQDGRTVPAMREHWNAALAANPEGTAQILAALPKGSALPVTSAGYTGGVEESADDDSIYAKAWGKGA